MSPVPHYHAPAVPARSPAEIKDVNVRYHDRAATDYDSKWGIDFGALGRDQVLGKLRRALGGDPGHYQRALEIGAGTGYFTLNLLQAGVIDEAIATDISPGMLDALRDSARELGVEVETVCCEAERLPFPAHSFDLVFGHAVLHHLPHPEVAFAELARVLRPGGTLVFCGEPSRYGDSLAALPKLAGNALAPLWRAALRAPVRKGSGPAQEASELEGHVDVHCFTPDGLGDLARAAGLTDVSVRGEELLANAYGWTVRTLEASAEPQGVPYAWRAFAHRSYMALQELDRQLLEPRLPATLFYNLLLAARAPGAPAAPPQ